MHCLALLICVTVLSAVVLHTVFAASDLNVSIWYKPKEGDRIALLFKVMQSVVEAQITRIFPRQPSNFTLRIDPAKQMVPYPDDTCVEEVEKIAVVEREQDEANSSNTKSCVEIRLYITYEMSASSEHHIVDILLFIPKQTIRRQLIEAMSRAKHPHDPNKHLYIPDAILLKGDDNAVTAMGGKFGHMMVHVAIDGMPAAKHAQSLFLFVSDAEDNEALKQATILHLSAYFQKQWGREPGDVRFYVKRTETKESDNAGSTVTSNTTIATVGVDLVPETIRFLRHLFSAMGTHGLFGAFVGQ